MRSNRFFRVTENCCRGVSGLGITAGEEWIGMVSNLFESVGKKLTWGILLLLTGMAGSIGSISYVQGNRAVEKQLAESIPRMAVQCAMTVQKQLLAYRMAFEGIAGHSEIRSMDWDLQRPVLERENRRLGFLGMGVIDREGMAKYPNGKTVSLRDRAYFKKALAGDTNYSNILISRVTNSPVMMLAAPIRNRENQIVGVLLGRLDGEWLSKITDPVRYGPKGYSFIVDDTGVMIANRNRQLVLDQTNFLTASASHPEYGSIGEMIRKMRQGETGFSDYVFAGEKKLCGYAPIDGTRWFIAVGTGKKEVFAQIFAMRKGILAGSFLFIVLGAGLAFFFARNLARPIKGCVAITGRMAAGDFSEEIPAEFTARRDELGELTRAFAALSASTRTLLGSVAQSAQTVTSSSSELAAVAQQMDTSAGLTTEKVSAVSAATSRISGNVGQASSAIEETRQNFDVIVSSSEQMVETFLGIGNSASSGRSITESAVTTASAMSRRVSRLDEVAKNIGAVTKTIAEISDQTNLLALNATIEAARAGEAGKGFAVVADEIKALARQTADATREIHRQIEMVQSTTADSVSAIKEIVGVIEETDQIMTTVSEAVDSQVEMSRDLSRNITDAASGVGETSGLMAQISHETVDVDQDMAEVRQVTDEARKATLLLNDSAGSLKSMALILRREMEKFTL